MHHRLPTLSAVVLKIRYVLSVRDHMTLRLAGATYAHEGRRASDALDLVGLSETRFWRRANWLLDQPAALEAYPQLVHRLRRLRAARQAQRSGRRLAG